jgi:DNA-directed RNA polymerase subunit RPC12/RpoP
MLAKLKNKEMEESMCGNAFFRKPLGGLPVIYKCKNCGDEIPRATQYQIRQDYCPDCFKRARVKRQRKLI